jgi:hypothetical protein
VLLEGGVQLPLRFFVPSVVISSTFLPALKAVARLENVNSSSGAVSIQSNSSNGIIRMDLGFEENGTEVVVDNGPDVELVNMKLTIHLGLVASGGRLSYNGVYAGFPIDTDIHGPFEWLIDLVVDVAKLIRNVVESKTEEFFRGTALKDKLTAALTERLKQQLGLSPTSQIHGVKVTTDQIVIQFTS